MKVGTGVGGWLSQVPEAARRADDMGYDFVSCGELAHDSMLTMTVAAQNSERIELQTSVTIAFPRSPLVLAYEAWDLQAFSKGRFTLGLGSQVKGHNERRFGMPWQPGPATRMKEYIKFLKMAWDVFQTYPPQLRRQALPVHPYDAELQPRPHRLSAPQGLPRLRRRCHGPDRRRGRGRHPAPRLHDRQVHAQRGPA